MKQTLYFPALACILSLLTGAFLRYFQLPGADMLLVLSSVLLMGLILLFGYSLVKVSTPGVKKH